MTGRVVVVTGTSTGVGKTVATAALAATGRGSVAVVKPVQTGIADGEPTDADEVERLTGVTVHQYTALDEPLAPDTAARRAGVTIPSVRDHADADPRARRRRTTSCSSRGPAGCSCGSTPTAARCSTSPTDLAQHLPVEVVVVTAAGLGTLNHTELTVGALRARGLEPLGLVIGSWPAAPGLAEQCNLEELPRVTRAARARRAAGGRRRSDPRGVRSSGGGLVQEPAVTERVAEHRHPARVLAVLRPPVEGHPGRHHPGGRRVHVVDGQVQRDGRAAGRSGASTPKSGNSSAIIQRAPPTASST